MAVYLCNVRYTIINHAENPPISKSFMKAIAFKEHGDISKLQLVELDIPKPAPGDVLIRVKALGVNRAETYMRKGEFGAVMPVSGIECVGEVVEDTRGILSPGAKVAAFMGGLGRTRNGTYAEYTSAVGTNVVPLNSTLSWADLAAIPESYATAWSCLFDVHQLKRGDVLLVRGATSALGQAAINLAKDAGATVLATTRNPDRAASLQKLGAAKVLTEGGELAGTVRSLYPAGIDCVLDLVGTRSMFDSLKTLKKDGRVVVAGFLGGREPIPFEVLTHMSIGADLKFFASFAYGSPDYPVSKIPLQAIVEKAEMGIYQSKPVRVFPFEQLPEAQRLMESNQANGKIVVEL
jgi:NADPH2:quinone reductase